MHSEPPSSAGFPRFDVANADDVRRLLRAAADGPAEDAADIEAALREAWTSQPRPELRARIASALAGMLRRRGLEAAATVVLENALETLRGTTPLAAALSRVALASAYAARGRDVEALVLARAALRTPGTTEAAEIARIRVVCRDLYVNFHALEPARAQRLALELLLPYLPLGERDRLEGTIASYRLDDACARGAWAEAMHQSELWRLLCGDVSDAPILRRRLAYARGHALAGLGRHSEAEHDLSAAILTRAPTDRTVVGAFVLRAQVRARRNDTWAALADAHAAATLLRSERDEFGADFVRRESGALGMLLVSEVREPVLAEEAFELAATAHVTRLRDLDAGTRRLTGLRDLEPAGFEVVSECRRHAENAARNDLMQIARAFERVLAPATPHADPAFRTAVLHLLRPRPGMAALCPWCGRVSDGNAPWTAIADEVPLPPDAAPRICPECASVGGFAV